jgi:hypothetical protein
VARAAAGLSPARFRRRPRPAHALHRRRAGHAARPALRGRQPLSRWFQPRAEPGDVVARHTEGGVALCPPGHRPCHLDLRERGAGCALAERISTRAARGPAAPTRLPQRCFRARLDGAAPRPGACADRSAGAVCRDRCRSRGCRRGREPRAARMAGRGARCGLAPCLGRLRAAGRRAGAPCVARRRPALAPHARGHPCHLARTAAPPRRRPRLAGQRGAGTAARGRHARACRLERQRPQRIVACERRAVGSSRPASRRTRALARACRLGAPVAAHRGVVAPAGCRIPWQRRRGATCAKHRRLAAVRRSGPVVDRSRPRGRRRRFRIGPLRPGTAAAAGARPGRVGPRQRPRPSDHAAQRRRPPDRPCARCRRRPALAGRRHLRARQHGLRSERRRHRLEPRPPRPAAPHRRRSAGPGFRARRSQRLGRRALRLGRSAAAGRPARTRRADSGPAPRWARAASASRRCAPNCWPRSGMANRCHCPPRWPRRSARSGSE